MTGSSKSSKPKDWLIIFAAVVLPAPMLPASATKCLARVGRRRTVLRGAVCTGTGGGGEAGSETGGSVAGVAATAFGVRLRWGVRGMRGKGLARLSVRVENLAQDVGTVRH